MIIQSKGAGVLVASVSNVHLASDSLHGSKFSESDKEREGIS